MCDLKDYETIIDGNHIYFSFLRMEKKVWEVFFTVNDSLDINPNIPKRTKLAITKWLLVHWKLFIDEVDFDVITCEAHKDDGGGEYRKKAYYKMGFRYKYKKPTQIAFISEEIKMKLKAKK